MIRGRFAPSPSGALHLGSARTALAAYASARRDGGRFVLRVEDLDEARTAPGATAAMLEDLRWLGVSWDEGPDVGGPHAPYVQSARRVLYEQALSALRERGDVYPCACSRRDVELAAQAPHGREPVYPGTCRDRDREAVIAEAKSRGRGVAWRFAVRSGVVTFRDEVFGDRSQDVASEVGDFVVFRSDGVPAYQLAVVVDDAAMEITEVLRGEDLLGSTARQVLLYRALGVEPPRWVHVPLVVGDDGVRLAKRHGSIALAELRQRGVEPARVREALMESLGVVGPSERAPVSLALLRERISEIGSVR